MLGFVFYRTELPQKFRLSSLSGQYSENGGLDVQDTEAGVYGRVQGIGGQALEAGEGIAKVSRELGLEKQCQSVTYKTVSAPEWCANGV